MNVSPETITPAQHLGRGRWIVPLVLFALLAALLIGGRAVVQGREEADLAQRLELAAKQTAGQLEAFLASHFDRIKLLSSELSQREDLDEAAFREASRAHQERHPGLQALNWVRSDGVILWVEPEASNRGVAGFDLSRHPVASKALERARRGREVVATPPMELLQGGWGFAAYFRCSLQGGTEGYLNAVFRLPVVLRSCLGASADPSFAYLLHYGDDLLGALGPAPQTMENLPIAKTAARVAGRELSLKVIAPPRISPSQSTWVDEALLGAGILLAGALAWLLSSALRQRAEAAMLAARYGTLLENAPDAVVAIDAETGAFIDGNRRCHELLGLSPDRLEGCHPWDLSPELQPEGQPSRETFLAEVERAARGEAREFDWFFVRPRDGELWSFVHLVRMPNPGRSVVRASIMDITERRELENRLRMAQAHEAMGRLAGAVAHDLNNLLTAILGCSELLQERSANDESALKLTGDIIGVCGRASQLTHQLLAFSRKSSYAPRPIDLEGLVNGMTPILRRLVGERVQLLTRIDVESSIVADPRQVELALLNLVVNARDAMPAGGCIRVHVKERRTARCVELRVRDEGEGLAPEVAERIFEPFFTTKKPGVGTGIGLATVREIVDRAGGEITVESAPGEGTEFTLVFPASDRPAPPRPEGSKRPSRRSSGRRVLLVEDDTRVRAVLVRALEGSGYRVRSSGTAEEAAHLFDEGPRVDVLVSDVVLPNRSGVQLERDLRRRAPDLSCVLITGYSEVDLDIGEACQESRRRVRSKPFAPHELIEDIEELLAAPPGTAAEA